MSGTVKELCNNHVACVVGPLLSLLSRRAAPLVAEHVARCRKCSCDRFTGSGGLGVRRRADADELGANVRRWLLHRERAR
jgi:hypothetical protein